MDLCLTILCQLVNGQCYCALLRDEVRQAVHCKQPELLEHDVILLQDNATPHRQCDVENVVQLWDWDVLAHPPYSTDLTICDYWLFACVKEHLWVNSLNQDDVNIAVSDSLHRLSKDEYRAAVAVRKVCGQCW